MEQILITLAAVLATACAAGTLPVKATPWVRG